MKYITISLLASKLFVCLFENFRQLCCMLTQFWQCEPNYCHINISWLFELLTYFFRYRETINNCHTSVKFIKVYNMVWPIVSLKIACTKPGILQLFFHTFRWVDEVWFCQFLWSTSFWIYLGDLFFCYTLY